MHTVIVGGGFAGVKAALELSKRSLGKITLISDQDYFLYHATLYATATGRSKDESVIPLKEIFKHHPGVKIVKDRIKAVDADRRMVVGRVKSYSYNKLIMAVGVETTHLGIKGLQKYSFGIRELDEVKQFNKHLHNDIITTGRLDRNYFVIGGGSTGVELAGALAEYLSMVAESHQLKRVKPKITLVEASERILPKLSKTASKKVHKRLTSMGVRVMTGSPVQDLDDDSIQIKGRTYKTRTAIWTSGIGNHPIYKKHSAVFELDRAGKVVVDPYMMAAKNIYVLGDNADTSGSGYASNALKDGRFIAKHLTKVRGKRPVSPRRPFRSAVSIPVGDNWAYVEKYGIYAAGKLGAALRRLVELRGYLAILPLSQALFAWSAREHYQENCNHCKKIHRKAL